MTTVSDVVWLYAVAPAGDPPDTGRMSGVAGEPVRLVTEGTLAAVVGGVPAADFAEAPLKEHLEDLRWLEEAARAHHQVIDTVFRGGDVVPLQFATVYHDDEAVRAVLRERGADFADAFARVRGRAEWGVKGYIDPAAREDAPGDGQGTSSTRPGTAYLLRRKAQQGEREQAYRRARDRSADIRQALEEAATRAVAHPPQDPRLAGYEGWMILNDSFLVARDQDDRFSAAVTACAERFPDVDLQLSGPWPPYSFVGEETRGRESGEPRV
ncbi:GvpL/GvpF family gas vesicle protein [Streptomyces sp. NPDC051976]|uniref:GvpL/GvpF family gas vesicle protein n=1 Tax=Streptomyces sp. NPDC051976 TaxID=3154947 RepID=UPI0034316FA6